MKEQDRLRLNYSNREVWPIGHILCSFLVTVNFKHNCALVYIFVCPLLAGGKSGTILRPVSHTRITYCQALDSVSILEAWLNHGSSERNLGFLDPYQKTKKKIQFATVNNLPGIVLPLGFFGFFQTARLLEDVKVLSFNSYVVSIHPRRGGISAFHIYIFLPSFYPCYFFISLWYIFSKQNCLK